MDEISSVDDQKVPNLFLYSLLVPGCWLALGVVVELVAPGFRLGIAGTAGFFILMAVGICWLILQRYGRMPTNSESWRLVIYCSALAVAVETLVLYVAVTSPGAFSDVSITPDAALVAIFVSAAIDTLFFTLAFKVAAPNFLKSAVAKRGLPGEESE